MLSSTVASVVEVRALFSGDTERPETDRSNVFYKILGWWSRPSGHTGKATIVDARGREKGRVGAALTRRPDPALFSPEGSYVPMTRLSR
jgi:hypothetical protein